MQLSHTAAQHLMLAAQGLDRRPAQPATKADVLSAIRRMEVLQIDTIHVVARSPYLVLWSRLGQYDPRWLDELLAEGALFEYWAHEACFVPIESYGLYRRLMLDQIGRKWQWAHAHRWADEHAEQVEHMLHHIREHGPVRSSDFVRQDGQVGTWWNWKPEKITLEILFTLGELMVRRRHNFQRIYDLRERVLPTWNDADAPPYADVQRTFALKAVQALGIATAGSVPDYFRTPKTGTAALLEALADEGKLMRIDVEGWRDQAYVHPDNLALAEQAAASELVPELTTLLSPFDPLVWDRQRALSMWNFDYRIECYTPEAKRRYGYFSLPILHRGALIGRLDAKAHRVDKLFEVKVMHLEPGVIITDALIADLAGALRKCAAWHNIPEIVVRRSELAELAGMLNTALGV